MSPSKTQTGLVALSAASAEITTASVTIRTLRVNSRQLTQGTFRQLQKRELIDEKDCRLLGTVWGWVNYNPDGHSYERQFVVQFGEELARCSVWLRNLTGTSRWTEKDGKRFWPKPILDIASSYDLIREDWLLDLTVRDQMRWPERQFCPDYESFKLSIHPPLDASDIHLVRSSSKPDLLLWIYNVIQPKDETQWKYGSGNEKGSYVVLKSAEVVQQEARENLRKVLQNRGYGPMTDEDWARIFGEMAWKVANYMAKWDEITDRLRSVEQLFIAT